MFTICPGTSQSGQAAKTIFKIKKGDQHKTKVKKTKPRTLVAFCSVATAFADRMLRLLRLLRNLQGNNLIELEVKSKRRIQLTVSVDLALLLCSDLT